MDKMREEYENWHFERVGDVMDNKSWTAFVAGYQAATAEAEKYREALEKIAKPALGGKLQQQLAKRALKK